MIFALLPVLAMAQGVGVAGGGSLRGASPRTATICLVPDIQNMTSMTDGIAANPAVDCSQTVGQYCTGASCVSSPYCYQTWRNTGQILLENMARSLTGGWSAIDYSNVRHTDNVRSRIGYALDHGRCDAIIGLGDNMDTTDLRTYAQLTAAQVHEYNMALNFWSIVKASGIPYLIARGNHDGEGAFRTMLTSLGVASESFYVDGLEDQYAISFSTKTGKSFCALTLDDNDEGTPAAGGEYTAAEAAWTLANVGCGSNLPTILVGHEIIQSDSTATPIAAASTVINDAASGEVFIAVGGHYTPATPLSRKVAGTNGLSQTVLRFFSNWQEMDRHGQNINGNGITTSDGAGGMYTVISVDAANNRVCGHDWNPYWQVRSGQINGQDFGAQTYSSACFDFNFDARFP